MNANIDITILHGSSSSSTSPLGRLFSSSSHRSSGSGNKGKQADAKQVFEGMDGLSLQAALNQHRQLQHMLHGSHYNPNMRDADGDRYPLHWAAARGHIECVRLLLMNGAEPEVFDASGHTPGLLARQHGHGEICMLLGDDPDATSTTTS